MVGGEVVGYVSRLAMDDGNGRERENRGGRDFGPNYFRWKEGFSESISDVPV